MKLILLRPYMTKPTGATLNSVPFERAKKLISRGIAMLVEEKQKTKRKNKK